MQEVKVLKVTDEEFTNIIYYALSGPIGVDCDEEGQVMILDHKVDNHLTGRVTLMASNMLILDFKDGDLIDFTVILNTENYLSVGDSTLSEGGKNLC